jgi:hypothetical protein
MKPILRFEAVEVPIPASATATRFPFPDLASMRSDSSTDIGIRSIKFWPAEEHPTTFNGNPTATMAMLQNADLTLVSGTDEMIFRMPLTELVNSQNFDGSFYSQIFPEEFGDLKVDWVKSYITVNSSLGANAAFAFLMGVSYIRLPAGTLAKIELARQSGSNMAQIIP